MQTFLQVLILVLPWATRTRHASLIHRFLCFTAKEIIGISKVWPQHHLLDPNFDSAIGINNRLYYSPDSHSAFDCSNRGAAA